MPRFQRSIYRLVTQIHLLIDQWLYHLRLLLGMGTKAPIIVVPYPSYGRSDYIYLQGRVLKEKPIISLPNESEWKTLKNNFIRAWSVEIRNATLEIEIGENYFSVKTDKEGYFKLDSPLTKPLKADKELWKKAKIKLIGIPWRKVTYEVEGPFILPDSPQLGIISDIDDTIIETRVNSPLKLKMFYLAFFKHATKRKAFSGVGSFLQGLQSINIDNNPIFYVSKSPWNIADHIEFFLQYNKLPQGPLLLRDYGLPYQKRPTDYKGHKYENIAKILRTYPHLKFLLIGDSGEKDLNIYLSIAKAFPNRVSCIYIHDVRKKKSPKIKRPDFAENESPLIHIFTDYHEARTHALKHGFINQ